MTAVGRTDDERTVLEFFAAWEEGDLDRIVSYFTPDARFLNAANPGMPVSPRCGHDAIRAWIAFELETRAVRIETHRIASNDEGDVFTERTDWMRPLDGEGEGEGEWVSLPIAGVLHMRDGKVAEWREYLDTRVVEERLGITIERQPEDA
jgi:limonene-1,2-epoxide hydrolase